MSNIEIWKDVVGYEGRYQVSNYGRVRSVDCILKKKNGKSEFRKGCLLKLIPNHQGYYQVFLGECGKGKRKRVSVHRLVAMAFIPNPNNKPVIDHINTIRNDNRVENLRWVTFSENNRNPITMLKYRKPGEYTHSQKTRLKIGLSQKGKAISEECKYKLRMHGWPVLQFTKDGEFIKEFPTPYYAEVALKASRQHITACCNGKRKTAGGYRWLYKKDYHGQCLEPLSLKKRIYTKGYKHSVASKLNMKKSHEHQYKAVLVFTLDNTFVHEFSCIRDAAKILGVNSGSICNCCKGKNSHAGNYIFKYKQ